MQTQKHLFVYGTLAFNKVLHALLGYVPEKEYVEVPGYIARNIDLEGWEPFPVLLEKSGAVVKGYVLKNLTESDFKKLDRYEFTDLEYYVRRPLIEAGSNVEFYEPAETLLRLGVLGGEWDTDKLDPLLETIYAESIVPKFKLEHPDVFE